MASIEAITIEKGSEALRYAGLRRVELVDVLVVASAGDHIAIWNQGIWEHCVLGRVSDGCVCCFMCADDLVRELRLNQVCGQGAIAVLIEYEGGNEKSLEQSYEWARDQVTLTREDTLQRRLLRGAEGLGFAIRSRKLRCAPTNTGV